MLNLKDVINDEQLLFMALDLVANEPDDEEGVFESDTYEWANEIVFMAAIRKLHETSNEVTEDEVEAEVRMIVLTHVLDKMTRKGLIEEDMDGRFSITDQDWKVRDF